MSEYSKCPHCGYHAWNGRRCLDCDAGASVWDDDRLDDGRMQ